MEGKLNLKIKKLALQSLTQFYRSSSSTNINPILILKSLDILEMDKLDDDYFIDFDYLNALQEPLLDYYIGFFTFDGAFGVTESITSMPGVLNMMLDTGVLITSVEYLKRKRVHKLNKISSKSSPVEDDDFFDID